MQKKIEVWAKIISEYMTEGSEEYLQECLGQVRTEIHRMVLEARLNEIETDFDITDSDRIATLKAEIKELE